MTSVAPRVLVLDDEADIRESLAGYLEDSGLQVLSAGSAEEALTLDGLDGVAVAVVDIRLGGMDGVSFIRRLHAARPHVRFLIHTGSTDFRLDDGLRAIGLTDEDVLYKPVVDLTVFEMTIRDKMGKAGT